MAGIDSGGGSGGRRAANHHIPLIPFIDFLLCLVMFLLVTAVWSDLARLQADAHVPGKPLPHPAQPRMQLDVEMHGPRKFVLAWREGSTVLETIDVPRHEVAVGDDVTYPHLVQAMHEQWKLHSSQRAPGDSAPFRAVLHADNSTEFAQLLAVVDAINAPQRSVDQATLGRGQYPAHTTAPAFVVSFAVD